PVFGVYGELCGGVNRHLRAAARDNHRACVILNYYAVYSGAACKLYFPAQRRKLAVVGTGVYCLVYLCAVRVAEPNRVKYLFALKVVRVLARGKALSAYIHRVRAAPERRLKSLG